MQAGWHSVHRIHGRSKGGAFLPLTEMEYHEKHLAKLELNPLCARDIRKQLADMGIKHATVYGDLLSVSASLQSEFGVR